MAKNHRRRYVRVWGYLFGAILLVVLVAFGIQQFLTSGESSLQQAQAAYITGNYAVAVEEFNNVLAEGGQNRTAFIGLGYAYIGLEEFSAAQDAFAAAVALDPENSDTRPHTQIGLLEMAQGNYSEALTNFDTVINLQETPSASAYVNRARVYYEQGNYDSALEDLLNAQASDENYNPTYLYLGDTYFALGENTSALTAYERYLANGGEVDDNKQARINSLR